MKRTVAFLVLAIAPFAFGTTVIHEWSGYYQLNEHYRVLDGVVTILHGSVSSIPWKFQAFDSDTGAPGDIRAILIQPTGLVGVIHLNVIGDANHPLGGAANVGTIDLVTNADAPNSLDQLVITGNLGAFGPTLAESAGPLTIGGDVLDDITITSDMGQLTISGALAQGTTLSCEALGDVAITQLDGHIDCISLGDTTIGDGQHQAHGGDIRVLGANHIGYNHDLYVNGSLPYIYIGLGLHANGRVEVTGDMEEFSIGGPLAGSVSIMGSVAWVAIGSALQGALYIGGEVLTN